MRPNLVASKLPMKSVVYSVEQGASARTNFLKIGSRRLRKNHTADLCPDASLKSSYRIGSNDASTGYKTTSLLQYERMLMSASLIGGLGSSALAKEAPGRVREVDSGWRPGLPLPSPGHHCAYAWSVLVTANTTRGDEKGCLRRQS